MKNLYLSFGENCLTDGILKRHGLKSFTTPYSHGRSNIEYILHMEKDKFEKLMDRNNMKMEDLYGKDVLRMAVYDKIINSYNPMHTKGFEFTHHDIINDSEQREKIERRYKRLLSLDKENRIFIFYHHRICDRTSGRLLLRHLEEIKNIYLERCSEVEVIMFTQVLVDDISQRRVEHHHIMGTHVYLFYTKDEWTGNDQNIFWAHCDDDLIKVMIDDVKKMGAE